MIKLKCAQADLQLNAELVNQAHIFFKEPWNGGASIAFDIQC